MSDLKITALPRKAALAVNDIIPIVDLQFGAPNYVNKKTTIGDLVTIVSNTVADISGYITEVNGQTGVVNISVDNLVDTAVVAPGSGDILIYDSETAKWANVPFVVDGKIPADYLPSYVDDVLEYASIEDFPEAGEAGKIYVAVDTKRIYRWSGSIYVEIGNVDPKIPWDNIQELPAAIEYVAGIADFPSYIASSAALSEELPVLGVEQGAYSSGDVIPAGTPIADVIKNMLRVRIAATYTAPSLSIQTSGPLVYEYGAVASVTFTLNWAQNDAGAATRFEYRYPLGVLSASLSTPPDPFTFDFDPTVGLIAPVTFSGRAVYGAGPVKQDNFGDPSPEGSIEAGEINSSNSITLTPRHKRYWGLSANPAITDAELLQLNSELATSRAQIRNDFNPVNQYIYIAYPASFGLATIKFNGYIATSAWPLTTRNFTNANGYTELYHIYRTQYTQNSPDIDIEVL